MKAICRWEELREVQKHTATQPAHRAQGAAGLRVRVRGSSWTLHTVALLGRCCRDLCLLCLPLLSGAGGAAVLPVGVFGGGLLRDTARMLACAVTSKGQQGCVD
jgi:hypothetical protein